ncbi:MAG: glucosyl-3-phosphoglycerate synthase [Anaerolineae bacterium]|nr:glucosyl-3-phosphoglycerate synthase [Anaerolineae bacterium]
MAEKRNGEEFQVTLMPRDNLKHQIHTIVVPIFDEKMGEWGTRLALDLALSHRSRVVLVGMVRVSVRESLSTGTAQAQAVRATLDRLRTRFAGESVYFKPRVRVEHEPWRSLARVVAKEQANLIIIPWPHGGARSLFGMKIGKLLGSLNCHIVVVSGNPPAQLRKILLPLRGSQEAPLALEVALSLAKAAGAEITMLYAADDDRDLSSQRVYAEMARISQGNPLIEQELRVEGHVGPAIIERAAAYDLTIIGVTDASSGGAGQSIGPVARQPRLARQLRRANVSPLLIIKTHQPPPLDKLTDWDRADPLPATPTSVMVDKWFAENTFSSQEFEDLEHLVKLKEQFGQTISLGLPSLNEEETIGIIIQTMQDALMKQFPLLDEIVLIDSGSTDYTVDIAMDLGVPVYQHSQILPKYGTYRGKGEALWKSLHVLKGDLIAWIDTDIVNIHPRFVYGILGPLLYHNSIQYVKGFYRRPLKVGDSLQAGGGGRVTELVARPLFNLFYPELSGILQPLSGEYAGRRTALQQVPFYTGYGVETGLLLSLVRRFGISGIAQVDLRQRIHHNQSLGALSRMSFAIIQVFIDHLERRQKVELLSEVNRTMKIIRYDQNSFSLQEHAISDRCRPPIIALPEYRKRHSISEWDPEEVDQCPEQERFEEEDLLV